MNRFGSHLNHENLILYEGLPLQGLSEARRGTEFFLNFLVIDPPLGRSVRCGGIHPARWIE